MVSNILLKSCCAENLLWRAITEPAAISEFVWVTTVIGPLLLREKLQYRTFQTCPPPHGLLTSWQTGHSTWDWAVVRLTWWCAVPEPLGGLRYAMRTDTREMDVDLRRKRMATCLVSTLWQDADVMEYTNNLGIDIDRVNWKTNTEVLYVSVQCSKMLEVF